MDLIAIEKIGILFGTAAVFISIFSGILYGIIKIGDKVSDKTNNKSKRLYGIQDEFKISDSDKDKEYKDKIYEVIEKIINDKELCISVNKEDVIASKKESGNYDLLMICNNKYSSTLWVSVSHINREPDKIKIELIHDNTKIEIDKRELRLYKESNKLEDIMEYILDYIENGEDAKRK